VAKARVFRSGNGQAVQLPNGFRLTTRNVEIFRRGEEIILREKPRSMVDAYWLLAELPDDFMADGRQDGPPQVRKAL
jgi:antitoxin VapB